ARLRHREVLAPLLDDAFRRRTTDEWLRRLRGHVPVAPVYTVEETLADAQVIARDMIVDVAHPEFGTLRELGCPIKLAGVIPRYTSGAALGADTAELLAEIGLGAGGVGARRA